MLDLDKMAEALQQSLSQETAESWKALTQRYDMEEFLFMLDDGEFYPWGDILVDTDTPMRLCCSGLPLEGDMDDYSGPFDELTLAA